MGVLNGAQEAEPRVSARWRLSRRADFVNEVLTHNLQMTRRQPGAISFDHGAVGGFDISGKERRIEQWGGQSMIGELASNAGQMRTVGCELQCQFFVFLARFSD